MPRGGVAPKPKHKVYSCAECEVLITGVAYAVRYHDLLYWCSHACKDAWNKKKQAADHRLRNYTLRGVSVYDPGTIR